MNAPSHATARPTRARQVCPAPVLALRAALFAAVCVALASGCQILLSGRPVPLATLALSWLGAAAIGVPLARRERGFWAIAGLLLPMQFALGALYRTGQDHCAAATGSLRGFGALLLCGGQPRHGAVPALSLPGAQPQLLAAHAPELRTLTLLGLGHVGVGLAAAWWLRRGEAVAFRAARAVANLATRGLRLLLTAPTAPTAPWRPLGRPDVRPLGLLPHAHAVSRRGPPVLAA